MSPTDGTTGQLSGARMVRLMLESLQRKDRSADWAIDDLAREWDSLSRRQLRWLVDDLCEVAFVLAVAWRDDGGSLKDALERLDPLSRDLGR